jgi:cytochrome P450
MFLDPRYFKEMLMQHQHYTTVSIYNHADIWDGGLVASHGESWKQKRKVVAPYFLYENLQKRAAYLNAIMQERFDAEFSNLSPEGRVIDMYQFATQISGEAMIRTFFGNQITEFQGKPASLFIVDLFRDRTTYLIISFL